MITSFDLGCMSEQGHPSSRLGYVLDMSQSLPSVPHIY